MDVPKKDLDAGIKKIMDCVKKKHPDVKPKDIKKLESSLKETLKEAMKCKGDFE